MVIRTSGPQVAIVGAIAFLGGVAFLATVGRLQWLLFAWYVALSLVTYWAYAADKHAAVTRTWRIANSRLHFLGLIGGWPGAWVGQQVCRNKNRQPDFQVMLVLTICAHVALVLYLAMAAR